MSLRVIPRPARVVAPTMLRFGTPQTGDGTPNAGCAGCPEGGPLQVQSSHSRSRVRDTIRLGLVVASCATILGAFTPAAQADSVPTGLPPSPLMGATKFSQPLPRFDVLPRNPVSTLNPAPTEQSTQTQHPVAPALGGGTGPIEGRPPGPVWAHQGWTRFPPQVAVEVTQEGAKTNFSYDP